METGVREHDGFYLRMGIGVGRLGASFNSERSTQLAGSAEGSFANGAFASELAFGGTPAPGLVIGGTINLSATGDVTTQDLTVNGAPVPEITYRQASLLFLGPFIDYYIDAHLGWHVQGALGIAGLTLVEEDRSVARPRVKSRMETGGLGFAIGAGWEGWVAKQWSMGVLLRLMYASVETNQDDNERWAYRALAFPEFLYSVTFH